MYNPLEASRRYNPAKDASFETYTGCGALKVH